MNTEEKELTQSSLTINSSSSTSLTAKNVSEQLISFGKQLSATLEVMPSYLDNFWQVYKSMITFIAWVVASIVALKIVFSVLGGITEIPLLSPILELIGIVCGGWVTVRYLINAESRAELGRILNSAKQCVVGDR